MYNYRAVLDVATCLVLALKATSALPYLLLLSLFLGLDQWHYLDVSSAVSGRSWFGCRPVH